MIFLFNENAGKNEIKIQKNDFQHLIKSQRKQKGEVVELRNLKDDKKYFYQIKEILKKEAILKKIKEEKINQPKLIDLNIFWCIVDPKTIKDTLPFLNQLNLKKLFLVYCERSQKNFKINLEKIKEILIHSSEQSGRHGILEVEILKKINWNNINWDNTYILDFNGKDFSKINKSKIKNIFIGPEGGFSEEERKKFPKENIISFENTNVLKSETALIAITAKFI